MDKPLAKPKKIGATNHRTSSVRRLLEDEFGIDFDPLIELIRLGRRTDSDQVAAKCYAEAAKYVHPQLKSMEINKTTMTTVLMPDNELANRFRQYMEQTSSPAQLETDIIETEKVG